MTSAKTSTKIMHSALVIKNWVCNNTSPFIWSSVISRALPEMLEINPQFSAMNINKKTKWCKNETEIIRYHLQTMYEINIPTEVLYENANVEYETFNFFGNKNLSVFTGIKRLFKVQNVA